MAFLVLPHMRIAQGGVSHGPGRAHSPGLRILVERTLPAAPLTPAGPSAPPLNAANPEYVPVAIEPPTSHTRTRAYGINNLGQVAGRVSNWNESTQQAVDRTAFVWDPVSGIHLFPSLGGESSAWGLNNEGQASGWSYLSYDPASFEHAVRWKTTSPRTATDLGTLANSNGIYGNNSTAYDLNDDGAVTGYSDIPNLAGDFTPFHAILYTDAGGLQDLGTFDTLYPYYQYGYSISYAATAAGQVVGLAHNSSWYFRPFIYDDAGGLRELPIDTAYVANEWYAVAINDSGRIGGHAIAGTDHSLPYYWTSEAAAPIALSMPAGFPYGEIYGINSAGVMVGIMWNDAGTEHAFVFDTIRGVRDLNDLIDPAAGWVLNFARDINETGQIVGSGTQSGLERGFILAPFVAEADVSVAKTADTLTPQPGSLVTFTITAANNGPDEATGVVVTDLLPAAITYDSATSTQGSYAPETGVWDVGTLAEGETATLTLAGYINSSGTIVNTATKTEQVEADPDPANDAASVTLQTTPRKTLLPPLLLEPPNNATGQPSTVALKWQDTNNTPQEIKYKVRIKRAGGSYTNHVVPANAVEYIKSGLTPGKAYSWNVQAVGNGTTVKTSAWANAGVDFRFTVAPPVTLQTPVLLSPANGALGQPLSVTLEWQDTNSSPQEVGYRIRFKVAGGTYTNFNVGANVTSFGKSGLARNKTYYWSVQAKGNGTSIKNSAWPADWKFTTMK